MSDVERFAGHSDLWGARSIPIGRMTIAILARCSATGYPTANRMWERVA
ncbi:MAG: hypothetical protein AAGB05_01035 [Pseudomonadota bacterium]